MRRAMALLLRRGGSRGGESPRAAATASTAAWP